uniref:MYB-CC type transcription factor LHEQLE-containing domain-containing protein n=1 Tax=Daucus carota subsp. sativus TaxID=79200 RepID=A0A175YIC3_DAUCS
MPLQNMQQDQDMNLVLSSDAKPRLKWNPELHQRFVHAVAQLGGADKATPKALMRVMRIQGLTLYHLKSHLQAFVQRHLQLRIEAQGKYLQSVLKKAQDTLSGCNPSSAEVELAKTELSQLVSMVDNGCPSSSLSMLTETHGSFVKDNEIKPLRGTRCSLESSLTSSESSGRKEEKRQKHETDDITNNSSENFVVLSLMEMHSREKIGSVEKGDARKRSESKIFEVDCIEQPLWKRSRVDKSPEQLRKFDFSGTFDLNSHCSNYLDSSSKEIDLNSKEVNQFNDNL